MTAATNVLANHTRTNTPASGIVPALLPTHHAGSSVSSERGISRSYAATSLTPDAGANEGRASASTRAIFTSASRSTVPSPAHASPNSATTPLPTPTPAAASRSSTETSRAEATRCSVDPAELAKLDRPPIRVRNPRDRGSGKLRDAQRLAALAHEATERTGVERVLHIANVTPPDTNHNLS
jgi:hypothetical protein